MPQQVRRLLIAFAIFISLFLVLRYLMVPKSFGEFGHYRGLSLEDNAAKPMNYAGTAACTRCHSDIASEKNKGRHAGLACEGCHGPGYKHATFADTVPHAKLPDSLMLVKPDGRQDCALCHEMNRARTKIKFDTVNYSVIHMIKAKEHNLTSKGDTTVLRCIECHNPHDPF
jgi:hypothetical protein